MIIYLIKNKINSKVYVGQTTQNINDRWNCHKAFAKIRKHHPLYYSMNKYGVNNFEISILEKCKNIKELNDAEIF